MVQALAAIRVISYHLFLQIPLVFIQETGRLKTTCTTRTRTKTIVA